jgi:hypothetical protein
MGNRCIITDKDKVYQVYLHWNGELHHILGFLDGVKRLYDNIDKYKFAKVNLFNFTACIHNWFGSLGYNIDILKYTLQDNGDVLVSDNGHYEIDFDKFEIVKLYKNIYNTYINNDKQVLYEKEELQEMVRQEREASLQDILEISQEIFDVNKGIFGAVEKNQ